MKIKVAIITVILILSLSSASAVKLNRTQEQEIINKNILDLSEYSDYDKSYLLEGRTMINLIKQLDEELFSMYLENLTALGPRTTGTPGCDKGAEYIYNEFKSMNLSVRYHEWEDLALSGKNVEATLNGTDTSNDEIYIICGHYDTVPESVGADDNSAGTVSVMTAAKILSQIKCVNKIRFVLFSGEEEGLYGSYHYALDAKKNNDNIAGVINVDMTGYANNIESGNSVRVYENIKSSWITQKTKEVAEKYYNHIKLDLVIGRIYVALSDHFGFWQNGYDAVFYYENDSNPNFHTPKDNMKNVNITYATKIAKLSLATLVEISGLCGYYIGKKLYVGGAGPGNYTNLAEAVEDSRDGDIIYVYNGTYEGNVEIQNSIDIIGQGAKTTNITNEDTGPVITVYEDYTYIQGLSIKNTCKNWCSTGVYIYSDYSVLIDNEISDNNGYAIGLKNAAWTDIFYNKIDNNTNGVMIWGVSPDVRVHHNTITNNQGSGITLSAKTDYACIKYNLISNNQYGIYTQVGGKADTFGNPSHTNVYNNIFSENDYGIYLNIYSKYNKFIKNEFNNNKVGLYIGVGSTFNRIVKNNFIENELDATFESVLLNHWLRNYWDSKSINLGPKIIKGTMRNIPWKPSITVYNIDLLPAKNPYEITL